MEGGAARRNWATPVAPLAGEGVGKDEGLTNRRFVAADGWGSAGSRPVGGAQRAWPRRALLWQSPGLGGGTGDTGRLVGSRRGCERYWPAAHGPEERLLGGARRQCRRHELQPAVQAAGDLYRQARRRDAASMPRYGDRRRLACGENRRRTAGHLGADVYGAARAPTRRAHVPRRQARGE
jgi:hypothetical protein